VRCAVALLVNAQCVLDDTRAHAVVICACVYTGIPELRELEDIEYLRQMLSLEMSDEQAAKKFEALVGECMKSKATRLNNVIHILAH
jgi:hypothetical protein